MRKEKKVEDRANAAPELRRAVDEAARLALENATFVRELNRARLSTSSGTNSAVLSTSATSLGGP